jgi:hypothetical protein
MVIVLDTTSTQAAVPHMRPVQTNGELAVLHAHGSGLIFNDFTKGPLGYRDNRLHLASCSWVPRMLGADPAKPPTVRKFFFAHLGEALAWIEAERGAEGGRWNRCPTCLPGRLPAGLVTEAIGIPDVLADHVADVPSAAGI